MPGDSSSAQEMCQRDTSFPLIHSPHGGHPRNQPGAAQDPVWVACNVQLFRLELDMCTAVIISDTMRVSIVDDKSHAIAGTDVLVARTCKCLTPLWCFQNSIFVVH